MFLGWYCPTPEIHTKLPWTFQNLNSSLSTPLHYPSPGFRSWLWHYLFTCYPALAPRSPWLSPISSPHLIGHQVLPAGFSYYLHVLFRTPILACLESSPSLFLDNYCTGFQEAASWPPLPASSPLHCSEGLPKMQIWPCRSLAWKLRFQPLPSVWTPEPEAPRDTAPASPSSCSPLLFCWDLTQHSFARSPLLSPPQKSSLHLVKSKLLHEALQIPTIPPKQNHVPPLWHVSSFRDYIFHWLWGHEPGIWWHWFLICLCMYLFNKHLLDTGHISITILGTK